MNSIQGKYITNDLKMLRGDQWKACTSCGASSDLGHMGAALCRVLNSASPSFEAAHTFSRLFIWTCSEQHTATPGNHSKAIWSPSRFLKFQTLSAPIIGNQRHCLYYSIKTKSSWLTRNRYYLFEVRALNWTLCNLYLYKRLQIGLKKTLEVGGNWGSSRRRQVDLQSTRW